jgi:predicted PolB exonuclease-like 3'-5' exonuclease
MGLMISMGGSEKQENSLASFQESNHDFPLVHFTASHYTDWNIIAAFNVKLTI